MDAKTLFEELRRLKSSSNVEAWNLIELMIVNRWEETNTLEFKPKQNRTTSTWDDKDKCEVARAACAFANTDGGLLIIGIKTTSERGPGGERIPDQASAMDALTDAQGACRRLDDLAKELLVPAAKGIESTAITNPRNEPEGVIVMYVPPQPLAGPFQAQQGASAKGRFFMRASTSSVEYPYRALADAFGRRPQPSLALVAQWNDPGDSPPPSLVLYVRNEGPGTAKHPCIRFPPEMRKVIGIPDYSEKAKTINTSSGPGILVAACELLYPGGEERAVSVSVAGATKGKPCTVRISGELLAVDAIPVPFDAELNFAVTARRKSSRVARFK